MKANRVVALMLVLFLIGCDAGGTPSPTATIATPTTAVSVPTVTVAAVATATTSQAATATSAPPATPTEVVQATATSPARPASFDNAIEKRMLEHDSRNPFYREPGGAQPAGGKVTLRVKTAEGDLESAKVRIWNSSAEREEITPMTFERSEPGADFWTVTLDLPQQPTVLWYRFILQDGSTTTYYEDNLDRDGGLGTFWDQPPDYDYLINVYDPNWTIPEWTQDAVVYQIFPDRFNNSDPSNDRPSGTFVYGGQTSTRAWDEPPATPPMGSDFYGGDLEGVIQKLDYLQQLGVTLIYFNPIFASPSNHRYDTTDYFQIDPALGRNETFTRLMDEAKKRNIRVMLDGVFNHSSSDSLYFDKFQRYDTTGAAESQDSPYYGWYQFVKWPLAYNSWGGYDSLPAYTEVPELRDFIFGKPDSVAQHWIEAGVAGWRLDAAEQKSHDYWRDFRSSVRAAYPDTLIVGEFWQNAAPWFNGDQWDGVMNYRFRNVALAYLGNAGMSPEKADNQLAAIREDYPPNAVLSSMNILDSHDTVRALTSAGGNKNALMQMALLQFASPGMPTIYYGDEAGLAGSGDPDNRRTYPWDSADQDLIDYYSTLAAVRHKLSALRTGTYQTLLTENEKKLYVFMRKDDQGQAVVAFNTNENEAQEVEVDVAEYLEDGTAFGDVLTNGTPYKVEGGKLHITVPARWGSLLVPENIAAEVKK